MRQHVTTTAITYCLLALTGAIAVSLPESLSVSRVNAKPAEPDTVRVNGVVRDFHKTDANFAVAPSGGNGHYAGNLALVLDAADRPAFAGGGFKVASQWRDQDANPIAPHLYKVTYPAAVMVKDAPTLSNNPVLNTYYSDVGPYGGANIDDVPQWITNSPMPAVAAPTGMPAVVDEYLRSGAGTSVISGNLHFNKFDISNGHRIRVNGDVVMLVNDLFKMQNLNTNLELSSGATFTLYFKKDATVQDRARIHLDTATPERVKIYNLGTQPFIVQNQAQVVGLITSPAGPLHIQDSAHFYGRATALQVHMQNTSGLHIDVGSPADACGVDFADTVGTKGVDSSGGIVSTATFEHWFRDTMGVNASMHHAIELVRSSDNIFEYMEDEFFPVDALLFGNEGQSHNNYFTYAIAVDFTHHSCDDRFFEFQGCDDAWAFVNGQLALDLGGVMPNTPQHVGFDRLDLTDGQTYTLHFYFAQRNATMSVFRLRTNLDLVIDPVTQVVSGGFD